MDNKLIKRWELNGKLLEKGDKLYVEYNPAEHIYFKKIFTFDGKQLINDDDILEVDSIYIDKIELI